jgi:hypothetical protein
MKQINKRNDGQNRRESSEEIDGLNWLHHIASKNGRGKQKIVTTVPESINRGFSAAHSKPLIADMEDDSALDASGPTRSRQSRRRHAVKAPAGTAEKGTESAIFASVGWPLLAFDGPTSDRGDGSH